MAGNLWPRSAALREHGTKREGARSGRALRWKGAALQSSTPLSPHPPPFPRGCASAATPLEQPEIAGSSGEVERPVSRAAKCKKRGSHPTSPREAWSSWTANFALRNGLHCEGSGDSSESRGLDVALLVRSTASLWPLACDGERKLPTRKSVGASGSDAGGQADAGDLPPHPMRPSRDGRTRLRWRSPRPMAHLPKRATCVSPPPPPKKTEYNPDPT